MLKKQSEIINITSFSQINFSEIPFGSMAIFDVDSTLIQYTDAFLTNEKSESFEKFFTNFITKHPEITDWDEIIAIMSLQAERHIIEPSVLQQIADLKKRSIPIIALTCIQTGPCYFIPLLEEWRYNHLKALGFEWSYEDQVFKLSTLPKNPTFYRGILATDMVPKGEVLGTFLDHKTLIPTQIIMIDDNLDYLTSVKEECQKRKITFQGYLYQGQQIKPWTEEIAEFQLNYLIQHKQWINDEQAKLAIFIQQDRNN